MYQPFKAKDPGYQEFIRAQEEVKKDLHELSVITQNILNDSRYVRFTDLVKQAEENTITLLLSMNKYDKPDKYKKYDEFITELGVYRGILRSVNDLANPKVQEKKNYISTIKNRLAEVLSKL